MKVSIITATYNSAETLADALRSVGTQTHPDIEHIVVDGLSTDDSVAIAKSCGTVSRVISEHDKGIYDAMNKGVQAATGDVIGILNSDDAYESPDVISRIVSLFQTTDCDAAYGDIIYVKKEATGTITRYWRSGKYSRGKFLYGWMPPHPSFFVKRELFSKFGMFELGLGTAADYEFMLRLIHKNQIYLAYLPQVVVRMREGGASNADLISRLQANKNDQLAWKLNGLTPGWLTLYLKPLRKLEQFVLPGWRYRKSQENSA